MNTARTIAAAALLLMLGAGAAHSATLVVTTTADPGSGTCSTTSCSLRDAINTAAPDDTITFAIAPTDPGCANPGNCTITVDVPTGPMFLGKNVTVDGTGQAITLDGSHQTSLLYIAGAAVTLNRLDFSNAYCDGDACKGFEGGGAITNENATLVITNSAFSGNSVGYSTVSVSPLGHPIQDPYGGSAIYNQDGGSVSITNVYFLNNSSPGDGNVIYNTGASATIANSIFTNNQSNSYEGRGGVIGQLSAVVNVTGSTFSGNYASSGGVFTVEGGTLNVSNSTLVGNSALLDGGALNNDGGAVNITNSTFSANTAPNGGVLAVQGQGTLTLVNSILAQSGAGGDCNTNPGTSSFPYKVYVDAGGNISDDGTCAFTQASSLNNANPMLQPLENYGGPTETMALPGTSPAVSLGVATACPATDQRGVARPGPGQNCSSGAFQYVVPLTLSCPAAAANVASSYNSSLAAAGGLSPDTFSITVGSLPPGLNLNTATGAITGTPTTTGTFSFTGQVKDSSGVGSGTTTANCSIIVGNPLPQLAEFPSSLDFGQVGLFRFLLRPVTVTNIGPIAASISGVALTAGKVGNARDFFLLNQCPSSLAAGRSCRIYVGLFALNTGRKSAILKIASNAVGSPQSVPISATVIP